MTIRAGATARRPRSALRSCVGVVASAVLLLSACSPGDDGAPTPSPSVPAPTSDRSAGSPALVDDDGFTTVDALPEPLASTTYRSPSPRGRMGAARADLVRLYRQGDAVRAVVAVLDPWRGEPVWGAAMGDLRRTLPENGWELYDARAGTVAEPLRTGKRCLCTSSMIAMSTPGVRLFWADFPAPASREVTLLMGRDFPPLQDVRVPGRAARTPDGDLLRWVGGGAPPRAVGRGAGPPVVHQVVVSTESTGGVTQTTTDDAQELGLPADVLFAVDSADLEPAAGDLVDRAARSLAEVAAGQQVSVTGHTDDQGGEAYNQDLSQRRALAVADRVREPLTRAGITLDVGGRGEGEPLVPNTDARGTPVPANRALNRRVSFGWTGAATTAAPAAPSTTPSRPEMPAATPAPAPSPGGTLASAVSQRHYARPGGALSGGDAAIRLDVTALRRLGDGRVRLDATVTPVGASAPWGGAKPRLPINTQRAAANETLLGTSLLDRDGGVAYRPLRTDDGYCLCTRDLGAGEMAPKTRYALWAYYPAPPAGVGSMDLEAGSFGRLEGVPLS